jgi:GntR family transcriptional repressor for pyruvate dehydrogenase complex
MMGEISHLIRETRIESLSEPGRPRASLAAHRQIADAIRRGVAAEAAAAMHEHVQVVSDVALLRS